MLSPGESSHYRAAYFLLAVPKSVSCHICDGWLWPCAAHISLPGKACRQGVQRTDGLQASSCSALGICPFEPSLCSSRAAPANRAQHLCRDLAMPAQPTLQPLLGQQGCPPSGFGPLLFFSVLLGSSTLSPHHERPARKPFPGCSAPLP